MQAEILTRREKNATLKVYKPCDRGMGVKKLAAGLVRLMGGFFLLSLGIVLNCQAGLGLAPWDVLSQGLSRILPMTMGQASMVSGLVILVFDVLMRERIGVGSILNMIFIGTFIDLINLVNNSLGLIPAAENLWVGILLLVLSFPVMAVGMYLYMSPRLGAGPRDSMMVAIKRRTSVPVGVCRMIIEAVVLVVGWLMGGTVGLGTVILVLGNGPAMQWCFKLFHFDVAAQPNESVADTLRTVWNAWHGSAAQAER